MLLLSTVLLLSVRSRAVSLGLGGDTRQVVRGRWSEALFSLPWDWEATWHRGAGPGGGALATARELMDLLPGLCFTRIPFSGLPELFFFTIWKLDTGGPWVGVALVAVVAVVVAGGGAQGREERCPAAAAERGRGCWRLCREDCSMRLDCRNSCSSGVILAPPPPLDTLDTVGSGKTKLQNHIQHIAD